MIDTVQTVPSIFGPRYPGHGHSYFLNSKLNHLFALLSLVKEMRNDVVPRAVAKVTSARLSTLTRTKSNRDSECLTAAC